MKSFITGFSVISFCFFIGVNFKIDQINVDPLMELNIHIYQVNI